MADTIKIEILEDGTLKIETDGISTANHSSADQLLNAIEEMLGSRRVTHSRQRNQQRNHNHVRVKK